MVKKIISLCLLIILAFPLSVNASFSDDVKAFEQKYPEIYGNIDPALTAQMEDYLQDVVDYVVLNYDANKDLNVQIKNGVASVLLTGDKYKNDLLPFLMEQSQNTSLYRAQLTEMQSIVRKEVLSIINKNNSSGSGGGGGGSTPGSTTTTTEPPQTNPVVTPVNPVVTPTPAASSFTDISGHWAQQSIESMQKLGLASGASSTQFAPDRTITRAEFAALLVRAAGIKPAASISGRFQDVPAGQWYFEAVNAAAEAGFVNGQSAGTFGPQENITREQMAVMIKSVLLSKGKATQLDASALNENLSRFSDQAGISSWARDGVATAVKNGIVKGCGNGQFAPGNNATRAEAVVMILNMLNLL